jgi:hypothetical protein
MKDMEARAVMIPKTARGFRNETIVVKEVELEIPWNDES